VSASKQKEMEKEHSVGLGKVAVASRKSKSDNPLPLLRKSSSGFQVESGSAIRPTRKRVDASGDLMDKIFQQEKQYEINLIIGFFFYINFISFNVARSPLFIEISRERKDVFLWIYQDRASLDEVEEGFV
jgi:hypothetical protein